MRIKSEDVIFWAHLGRTGQVRGICSPAQSSERVKNGEYSKANGQQDQIWNKGFMNSVKDRLVARGLFPSVSVCQYKQTPREQFHNLQL